MPPATPPPTPQDVRTARRALALTQDDLAARLGVTGRTVRAWEAGARQPPPFLILALAAIATSATSATAAAARRRPGAS